MAFDLSIAIWMYIEFQQMKKQKRFFNKPPTLS